METIPHRELRNNSSEILSRVQRGESFTVTNHGEVAAIIGPPSMSTLERLEQAGLARPARSHTVDFHTLSRGDDSSRDILADLRGE